MSSQPECRRCGDYVHRGLVVCEECSGILADEMKALQAENARLTDELAAARERMEALEKDNDCAWSECRTLSDQLRAYLPKDDIPF